MSSHLAILAARSAPQDRLAAEQLAVHGIDVAFVGPAAATVPGALFVHAAEGPRWPALAQALAAHAPLLEPYRYVWTPDTTLQFAPDALARLFAVCEHLGLDLAQPAFTPQSPCAHPIAWRHGAFQVRFTNYVDAAAPVFSLAMLDRVLPTLAGAAADADLGGVWPQLAPAGRVAIVDATLADRAAGAAVIPSDAVAFNLGGLLETGDALCLSERAAATDAMLEALMRSATAWTLETSRYTRYLAHHLDGTAATLPALEATLAGAGLSFNCVVPPRGETSAVPARPAALPADKGCTGDAEPIHEQALLEADLRDLRSRYAAVLDERDQLSALLSDLAGQLARAQYHCRELAASAGSTP